MATEPEASDSQFLVDLAWEISAWWQAGPGTPEEREAYRAGGGLFADCLYSNRFAAPYLKRTIADVTQRLEDIGNRIDCEAMGGRLLPTCVAKELTAQLEE